MPGDQPYLVVITAESQEDICTLIPRPPNIPGERCGIITMNGCPLVAAVPGALAYLAPTSKKADRFRVLGYLSDTIVVQTMRGKWLPSHHSINTMSMEAWHTSTRRLPEVLVSNQRIRLDTGTLPGWLWGLDADQELMRTTLWEAVKPPIMVLLRKLVKLLPEHVCPERGRVTYNRPEHVLGLVSGLGGPLCAEAVWQQYLGCAYCRRVIDANGYDCIGEAYDRVCLNCCCDELERCHMCEEDGEEGWYYHSVCSNCGEHRRRSSSRHMHGYCTRVWDIFSDINCQRGVPYLGIEIEARYKNGLLDESLAYVHEHCHKFAFCKEDSSVYHGYEICSKPMVLAEHRKVWQPFCENAHKFLKGWTAEGCGIHVHLSRNVLSAMDLGKLLMFLNHRESRPFITAVAGRDPERAEFCRRKDVHSVAVGSRHDPRTRHMDHHGQPLDERRYEMLNLQNRETVEFRIFRSNVSYNGIMRTLEFCQAVSYWCKDTSVRDLTPASFMRWVTSQKHAPLFRELVGWMTRGSKLVLATDLRRNGIAVIGKNKSLILER